MLEKYISNTLVIPKYRDSTHRQQFNKKNIYSLL